MKPTILQMGPYPEWDQTALEENFEVLKYFEAKDKADFLKSHGPKIRAIATSGNIGANQTIIQACPNLEIISVYGVGYDGVDIETCKERNIKVTNTPDVLTGDVADLAIGMALSLTRNINGAEAWVREERWQNEGNFPLQTRFFGKRAGILGMGRIGLAIAKRLQGFDMKISYHNRNRVNDVNYHYAPSPSALASNCDFLFVALAASSQTHQIVDQNTLQNLGPNGYLINISRGQNVDENALLNALEKREIAGAALDVFENEPNINPRFLTLPNALLQPHQGSATLETRMAMGALMRQNLEAYFANQPLLTPVFGT